jgi:hypothetical protein
MIRIVRTRPEKWFAEPTATLDAARQPGSDTIRQLLIEPVSSDELFECPDCHQVFPPMAGAPIRCPPCSRIEKRPWWRFCGHDVPPTWLGQ